MSKSITIENLMDAGCHFGHTRARRHPKMEQFVYLTREKVQVLDLEKTLAKLKDLTTAIENFLAEGKNLILVGTKRQAKDTIEAVGKATGLSYISNRWLGGTLTNFETVRQSIRKMNELEDFLNSEDAQQFAKKERVMKHQELVRMQDKFGGLKKCVKLPDGLFVIDPSFEHNALREARMLGLEVFAMLDTNSNPELVDEFVPANDDSAKSITLIMGEVQAAIERGLKRAEAKAVPAEDTAAAKTTPKKVIKKIKTVKSKSK